MDFFPKWVVYCFAKNDAYSDQNCKSSVAYHPADSVNIFDQVECLCINLPIHVIFYVIYHINGDSVTYAIVCAR